MTDYARASSSAQPLSASASDPPRPDRPKVFGIGFHKTGTTSLGAALHHLGYRVCDGARPVRRRLGNDRMMDLLHRGELTPIFEVAEAFEGFEDNPWFCLFRELDVRFPGSRFILTERDEKAWLDSVVNHFGRSESDFRRWIYGVGSPVGNERTFLERYRRHNRDVVAHFANRPGDLLRMSFADGDGWAELCGFLGCAVPDRPFPHANRRHYPRGLRSRIRRWVSGWRGRGPAP